MKTWMWLKEMRGCLLRGFARTFLGNHTAANYQNVVQDLLISYKAMGCNMSLKIHFLESHLDFFFPRKSRRSQWRKRWKISPRYYVYGKAVPRHVDLTNVGRLLLETEEGFTWRQITVKFNTPLHFRGKFLPVSWAPKVLLCTFTFLCAFETLLGRITLYKYLN